MHAPCPNVWEIKSFKTSKIRMSGVINVLVEGDREERGMKWYLLTAEASALLQEHLLPCHLDRAIGTRCPSWWAWNSPSRLVHTNGPLNP